MKDRKNHGYSAYRVRTASHITEGSRIIGYRANREDAVKLALKRAILSHRSIVVQSRNTSGEWEEVDFILNPWKFVW